MSCHLRGAPALKRGLEQAFGAGGAEKVAVRNVSCLGRCDQAPALSINDQIYTNIDEQRTLGLVHDVLAGRELPAAQSSHKPLPVLSDPYNGSSNYSAVRQFVQTPDWPGVVATLKAAGLRGMGGAGFPTGSKWEIVRNAPGKEKYIVCNADESEPGTIKDRFIMENVPYLVIEGMIMAGLVTGARRGILYIRHEYHRPKEILQAEIDRCYRDGLLGPRILGSDLAFDLEIFVSPGGYICGEESALLEAIEGKRAEPRNKPPFPGTNGLWNQPTAINNVETFTFATVILSRGADWFKSQGTQRRVRHEVRGHQRRCESSRRLRSPDGHEIFRADFRICRRDPRRPPTSRLRALWSFLRIPARIHGSISRSTGTPWPPLVPWSVREPSSSAPKAAACSIWHSMRCVLPQRVLRQMCSLSCGLAEISRNAVGLDRRALLNL